MRHGRAGATGIEPLKTSCLSVEYGKYLSFPPIINAETKPEVKGVLANIQSSRFVSG